MFEEIAELEDGSVMFGLISLSLTAVIGEEAITVSSCLLSTYPAPGVETAPLYGSISWLVLEYDKRVGCLSGRPPRRTGEAGIDPWMVDSEPALEARSSPPFSEEEEESRREARETWGVLLRCVGREGEM